MQGNLDRVGLIVTMPCAGLFAPCPMPDAPCPMPHALFGRCPMII
ncbi:hypothetical protein QUB57_08310 [Microcoleus sp. F6_C1]